MAKRPIWALMVTICASSVLVACAADKDRKNAQNMDKEAAAKVNEINSINDQLMKDQIYAIPGIDASKLSPVNWGRFDAQKRQKIQTQLETIRGHVGRIFEIRSHKDMQAKGDGTDLERVRKNAQFHLDSLNRFNQIHGQSDRERNQRGQNLIIQINSRIEKLRQEGIDTAEADKARVLAKAQVINWSAKGNEKRIQIRSQLTQLIIDINQALRTVVSAPQEELDLVRTIKRNAQLFLDSLNRFDRKRAG